MAIQGQQPAQAVQPVGTKPKQVGTGFTNFQRIAQAGQGGRLGQAVAGGVQAATAGAQAGVQAAQQQFGEQAKQTGLTDTEEAQKDISSTIASAGKPVPVPGQVYAQRLGEAQIPSFEAGTGPSRVAREREFNMLPQQLSKDMTETLRGMNGAYPKPEPTAFSGMSDKDRFAAYRSGQYAGPTQLAGSDILQQQAKQAQDLGQQLGTTGGRQTLLQRFAAKPTQAYTSGESKLDVALLGAQPQQQLQAAQAAAGQVSGQLQAAQTAAQEQAKQYQANAQALKQFTESQLGQAINPLTASLETRAAAENKRVSEAVGRIQAGQGTPDDFQLAGMGSLLGQGTYGVSAADFNRLIQKGTQEAEETRAQAATGEERQRLSALGQLAGQQALTEEFGKMGDEASKAYAYDPSKQIVGGQQLMDLVKQNKEQYEKDLGTDTKTISDINQQLMGLFSPGYQKAQEFQSQVQQYKQSGRPAPYGIQSQVNPADFINQYLKAPETSDDPNVLTRKAMREGSSYLGDQGYYGEQRDAIVNQLNQLEAQQNALKQLQSKYNIGSTFFGAPTKSAGAASPITPDASIPMNLRPRRR